VDYPADVMIFMPTASTGAPAFATLFAAEKLEMAFVVPEAGPYIKPATDN